MDRSAVAGLRSRRRDALRPAAAVALTTMIMVSGCAGPVELSAPTAPEATGPVCAAVMAALPTQVLRRDRRETRPEQATAAWGDPPITVRCGVAPPPGLTAASECLEVNGIGWYAEPVERGTLFTTIGRAAFLEVGVPAEYRPEADALVDLSAAAATIPQLQPCV